MFGTYSISFVFETHLPPPLPLPQKVAGLACRITDNSNDFGPEAPIDRLGQLRLELTSSWK
ncbi:uncharacterized protein ASPGLDRAFT_46334 [Aspergillus glaucus CBS 516.65]|uniref:Uncharacterized protein n=1 Tax=Aspergillus glaucus CBS 516.65 TaxID=1160497 RepID=A0A1L9VN23_ASPGL|nr:hypothetical protein ASPGLDRAFT_46334 [Aspergillus glaucus CBS 516.65]OJJ85327.1 hypothetical protein ASPGLDRAFT_46334 [Aspergillus glaucus CBS 516.65]